MTFNVVNVEGNLSDVAHLIVPRYRDVTYEPMSVEGMLYDLTETTVTQKIIFESFEQLVSLGLVYMSGFEAEDIVYRGRVLRFDSSENRYVSDIKYEYEKTYNEFFLAKFLGREESLKTLLKLHKTLPVTINQDTRTNDKAYKVRENINLLLNSCYKVEVTDTIKNMVVVPTCLQGKLGLKIESLDMFKTISTNMQHSGFVVSTTQQGQFINYLNTVQDKASQAYSLTPIFFHIKDSVYKNNLYSENFITVEGENGNPQLLPLNYVEKNTGLKALLSCDHSGLEDCTYKDIGNLTFSRSLGWYDADKYVIVRGELVDVERTVTLNTGDVVLDDEAQWIERHSQYYLEDECIQIANGDWELESECFNYNGSWYHESDESIIACDDCGTRVPSEEAYYSESNDEYYCNRCARSHRTQLRRMDYSTNVIHHRGFGTSKLKIAKELVYLGLELECKAKDDEDTIEKINGFFNNDYCVATCDGSLDDYLGVEYIFRPEGLQEQTANVHDFISKIGDCFNPRAGNGYGLHVHITRAPFSSLDCMKIQGLVTKYEDFFRLIGGRGQTEYQQKANIRRNSNLKHLDGGRYKMVNFGNSATIEFRFPKSKVNAEHIIVNMEMIQSVCLFCKYNLSLNRLDLKAKHDTVLGDYINYVLANAKTYKELAKFINEKVLNNTALDVSNLTKYRTNAA